MTHMFDMRCRENGIEHRFTKIKHPWTNGQVERMNRTIKEATVKRYHYDSHEQLRRHLDDFINAYNYGRRLKTLKGLTPYEFICKSWTTEPERFSLNPHPSNAGTKQVAPAIHGLVIGDDRIAVGFGWDDGDGATVIEVRTQPIGVERLVTEQGVESDVCDERRDPYDVVALSGQEHEADQISKRVHQRDDLGRQPASRASDGLIVSPPFAPLAF